MLFILCNTKSSKDSDYTPHLAVSCYISSMCTHDVFPYTNWTSLLFVCLFVYLFISALSLSLSLSLCWVFVGG